MYTPQIVTYESDHLDRGTITCDNEGQLVAAIDVIVSYRLALEDRELAVRV